MKSQLPEPPVAASLRAGRWRSRAVRRTVACALAAALAAPIPPPALAQFDNLPRLGEAAGDELSPAAERRLGEFIIRQIRRDRDAFDDAELEDYLNQFAAVMTSAPAAAGKDFEFFPVRETTVNAFALPGGFIGVHTGLVTAVQTESELAAVLAHEIGHVTQRHIARMLEQQRQNSVMMLASFVLAALAARSNPQAIYGLASLGDTVARQSMLSFSRDAEREADRVGLEILQHGGFDPNAAVAFFGRLQQIGRSYENNAPAYMRTHPVSTERISDLQLRIRESRYRQRVDSDEFRLLQAKLRAIGDPGVDAIFHARQTFELRTRDLGRSDAAAWFGLATVAYHQRDWKQGDAALAEARRLLGRDHPYFERLAIEARLSAGEVREAAERGRQAVARFPDSRALARAYGRALIGARDGEGAVRFLRERTRTVRWDPMLWHLLAEASGMQNERSAAHRAAAEEFALLGAWPAAIAQLRQAQRAGDADFYSLSMIDSRLREFEGIYKREREEMRERGLEPPPGR